MKFNILFSVLPLFVSVAYGQSALVQGNPSDNLRIYRQNQRKVDRRTGSFDLNYLYNPDIRHYSLGFAIDSGRLIPQQAGIAPGDPPHTPNAGGVQVLLYRSNGRIIEQFFISDPTTGRSCDSLRRGITPLASGTIFNVSLPLNRQISRIDLIGTQLSPQDTLSYEIGDILKAAQ